MEDDMIGMIYIETHDTKMGIGPFSLSGKLTDSFIMNMIRKVLTKNKCDFICMEEVHEIVVVFDCDDIRGIYSPKIEDVWPSEFGYMHFINRIIDSKRKKGGEK